MSVLLVPALPEKVPLARLARGLFLHEGRLFLKTDRGTVHDALTGEEVYHFMTSWNSTMVVPLRRASEDEERQSEGMSRGGW